MQCAGFQRNYIDDPNSVGQSFIDHAKECLQCKAFVNEMQKLDNCVREALAVEVPDRLVDNLLKIPEKPTAGDFSSNFVKFAIAATVLLVVGIASLNLTQFPYRTETLPEMVFQHISHEPEALAGNTFIKQAVIRAKMSDFGFKINSDLGQVTHLTFCEIGDTHGVHLVVQGQKGPVTLLFMPTIATNEKILLNEYDFVGYIVPAEAGSIAIVGKPSEPLEIIETKARQAIEWL